MKLVGWYSPVHEYIQGPAEKETDGSSVGTFLRHHASVGLTLRAIKYA